VTPAVVPTFYSLAWLLPSVAHCTTTTLLPVNGTDNVVCDFSLSLSILNLLPFVALLVPTNAVLLAFSLKNAFEVGSDEHFRRLCLI
jgi:hypothetical protein